MKKPKWVSFCGWAVIACIGLGIGIVLARHLAHYSDPSSVVSGLAILFSVPMAMLWGLGTLLFRSRSHQAEIRAEAMRRALSKSGGKVA